MDDDRYDTGYAEGETDGYNLGYKKAKDEILSSLMQEVGSLRYELSDITESIQAIEAIVKGEYHGAYHG